MSKNEKKQHEKKKELEYSKIQEEINKIQEEIKSIEELLVQLPSGDKINEINLDIQSIKNRIEEESNKILSINQHINEILTNLQQTQTIIADLQKYREEIEQKYNEFKILENQINNILKNSEFIENLTREYPGIKEKQFLVDHLVSKISLVDDSITQIKSNLENIKEIINNLEQKQNHFQNQISTTVESKITEFFENYQSRVDKAQTLKLIELEEKMNNGFSEVEKRIEDKILEYVYNVQSQIDSAQTQKIIELEEKIKNLIDSSSQEYHRIFQQTQENLKNLLTQSIQDKIRNIEEKLEKIELIDTLKVQIDTEQTQKILQIENKLQELIKQSTTEIHNNLVSYIKENEEKNIKLISSIEENFNRTIDKLLMDLNKIEEKNKEIILQIENLKQKYDDFVNLVNNLADKIVLTLQKKEEEQEEKIDYTENLHFDLYKLIDIMNRDDIQADYLFLKGGNRPILKSSKVTAAIGKITLKNGDILKLASNILSETEINTLKKGETFQSIKKINEEKYHVKIHKLMDYYTMVIKKIPYVNTDVSTLSIVNPDKLISKISNLVLFLGINNLKTLAFSTLLNYINQKQIKRIAVIEEKISYLFKEIQSIIDIFEYKRDQNKLQNILFNVLNDEYDIIALSASNLSKEIMKIISSYSPYKTFILNLPYENILSFYKDYKEIEEILSSLNIYITHKLVKGDLSIVEVVFVDSKIRELIKSEDSKGIKEYILSIEESDTQTFNESIGYLVKLGKISKEEAIKFLSEPSELEKNITQQREIEL
ncbi:MAG: hypothetical protein RMJ51_06790 [Candidatus Calescibacterium sp.]|nr:hypothetical protein [Candidatus Calescibacterium sp.]MCX7972357.1 hypothetical protein [bacterium]MDW8195922.1 hypothetical protein [Candidatus Calescibacterium sp.]